MASAPTVLPPLSPALRRLDSSTRPLLSSFLPRTTGCRRLNRRSCGWRLSDGVGGGGRARAMVQSVQQGPSATYAREMERLSAKESLLLAFKDAGRFVALVSGKTTDMHRIDVTERITALERLNPTPRPTTSPFLEGRWNLEWFGSDTPGRLFGTRIIFERLPTTLVNLSKVDVWIKDGYTKLTANMRILSSIEAKFVLSSKLSVEGPLRMKEESVEAILDTPVVIEQAVPEQLKSALGQASSAAQQLPAPFRDALSSGITIPLNGTIQRLFMISYLDDEILIIRDTDGVPEVLTRLDVISSPGTGSIPEYES